MTTYHAVMIDETGCEFGVDVEADTISGAHEQVAENYPESECVQMESPKMRANRESRMYAHINAGGDWDGEGRPFFHR